MALTRQQRAAQDLTEKLTLENKLTVKLQKLFDRISDDYYQAMKDSGVPQSMTQYQPFFEEMLLSHYQATAAVFSSRLQDQLGIKLTDDEKSQINTALMIFFNSEVVKSADSITQTNESQATEAVTRMNEQERIEMADGQPRYSQATKAAIARNVFKSSLQSRATTIATTETQSAAEASKFTENDVVNFRQPTINQAVPTRLNIQDDKEWTAILDSATRSTHVKADGQRVKTGDFFIVGGHPMRYPGDRSAPIKEWINCRCCAIYTPPGDVLRSRLAA